MNILKLHKSASMMNYSKLFSLTFGLIIITGLFLSTFSSVFGSNFTSTTIGKTEHTPAISGDGQYVAFSSFTDDMVVYDLVNNISTVIGKTHVNPAISDDGQYVAFSSFTDDMVVYDLVNNTSKIIGKTRGLGVWGDGGPAISGDGRYVAFSSSITNDIVVYDLLNNTSVNLGRSYIAPAISDNGRYVALSRNITDDVIVYDLVNNTSKIIGISNIAPAISGNGRYVIFNEKGGGIIVYDLVNNISTNLARTENAPAISADGQYVVFNSTTDDVIVYDLVNNTSTAIGTGLAPAISGDGQYIAFSQTITGDLLVVKNPYLVNTAPVLDPIGNKSVSEGQTLTFTVLATDTDGDALTYSATNLPQGATFNPQTRQFSWTPGFDQAGNYPDIEFAVIDDGEPIKLDVELIVITVGDTNRAPIFNLIAPLEIIEEEYITFTVTASDPDNNIITLAALNLPFGASFDLQTGIFTWTPSLAQAGVYAVRFEATDNGTPSEVGIMDVVITVVDNPTPQEQAENLIDEVISMNFSTNIENSYLANLKKIEKFINEKKIRPTINQLDAFINKVEADFVLGLITQTEPDKLIALAQALLADLQ